MSRGESVTEREYQDIKSMTAGSVKAVARIAKRSDRTIKMIRKSESYEEFVKMRKEYSRKISAKAKQKRQEEKESVVGDELLTGVTTSGRRITIFEGKENMVKLFTKPIPKSKAEAIQKALKDAGLDIFEDYFYSE